MRNNSPRRIDQAYTFLKVIQGRDYENSMELSDCYELIANTSVRTEILSKWRECGVARERLGLTARLLDEAEARHTADLALRIIQDSPPDEASAIELFMTKLLHHVDSTTCQEEVLDVLMSFDSRLDLAGRTILNCLALDPFTRANGLSGYPVGSSITLGDPSSEFRSVLEKYRGRWIESVESLLSESALSHVPLWIGATLAIYSRWRPAELDSIKSFVKGHMSSPEFLDSLLFGASFAHPSFQFPDYYPEEFGELLDTHHPEHDLTRYLRSIGKSTGSETD